MFTQKAVSMPSLVSLVAVLVLLPGCFNGKVQTAADSEQPYQHEETRELVALVTDAAELVRSNGEEAFNDFRVSGSRWRRNESYIFVLDPEGDMPVHPDPALEGKNQLGLKDVNGKPIIRGLIDAAMAVPGKPEGW
ncbi:MAG: cache domain-containing protein, partial [Methylobacter sp.]|nr:cache domain-containing protein [Methylobacter sp.]